MIELENLVIDLKVYTWKEDNNLFPSVKVMEVWGENLDAWIDLTVKELKNYTDREIIIRESY